MLPHFKGKEYKNPKLNFFLETAEGADAVKEAIEFIDEKVYKKGQLKTNDQLSKAA